MLIFTRQVTGTQNGEFYTILDSLAYLYECVNVALHLLPQVTVKMQDMNLCVLNQLFDYL